MFAAGARSSCRRITADECAPSCGNPADWLRAAGSPNGRRSRLLRPVCLRWSRRAVLLRAPLRADLRPRTAGGLTETQSGPRRPSSSAPLDVRAMPAAAIQREADKGCGRCAGVLNGGFMVPSAHFLLRVSGAHRASLRPIIANARKGSVRNWRCSGNAGFQTDKRASVLRSMICATAAVVFSSKYERTLRCAPVCG